MNVVLRLPADRVKDRSLIGYAVKRLAMGSPLAVASAGFLIVLVLVALMAPLVSPYSPVTQNTRENLRPPSYRHFLGTDDLGRDVFSRTIYGSRASLEVSLVAVGVSVLFGTVLGLLSGLYRGFLDDLIMRVVDALLAFPTLVLAIAVSGALGPGTANVIVAIIVVSTPAFARLVRGEVLRLRELPYIDAAHVIGCRSGRIMFLHLLPNVATPLVVQASVAMGTAIVYEAGLSFLGLGVQPPTPSWGDMINTARGYLQLAPWMVLAPGAAIMVTVLAFNFLSDGLRVALDPTHRGR